MRLLLGTLRTIAFFLAFVLTNSHIEQSLEKRAKKNQAKNRPKHHRPSHFSQCQFVFGVDANQQAVKEEC